MDFKNKIKLKQKDKENNKSISKDKYIKNNSNYLTLNKNKNKSLTSIISTKNYTKKEFSENILKDNNNNNINIKNTKNQNNNNYSYLSIQLIDKENDTYEQLKQKNKKLREIIIKVSKQLEILSIKYENIKNVAEIEKKKLLEKLEKISSNYKLYAESYKENAQLKKEKDILTENSSQINLFFNSCKNCLINLLKKNMQYYTKLKIFYENKNDQYKSTNFNEFIFSIKEEILNNLMQYKNQLDIINYPTFFYEYNTFIYEEINQYGLKKGNINYKAKKSIKNERNSQVKENNSFDEYIKYKKIIKEKEKENYKDKSPKENKKTIKRNFLIREKTPSKSNCNLSYYQNFQNFHKTHFHNCFNEKNSNNKNKNYSNVNTNKSNISKETEGIFGDVGNVIPTKKRYSFRK